MDDPPGATDANENGAPVDRGSDAIKVGRFGTWIAVTGHFILVAAVTAVLHFKFDVALGWAVVVGLVATPLLGAIATAGDD